MSSPARILDTSAIARYVAADGVTVSAVLSALDANNLTALVPATCLSEAYWSVVDDDEPMLDIFRTLPQIRVAPLEPGDALAVGGLARFLGSLGMAHACLLAAAMQIPLMTTEPILAGKMLRPQLIWEV